MISPTVWVRPSTSTPMIARRRDSAMALNTSVVVAARGIVLHYITIWEYVKSQD